MSECADEFLCLICGKEARKLLPLFGISISSDQTRYEGEAIEAADAECKKKQKQHDNEKKEMAKQDEHFKREWHGAELHGANDGGESLKDQMRAALNTSETNETEKADYEKRKE